MNFIRMLHFNKAEPFIARSAARAVIGTINALVVNLAATHLRNQHFGRALAEPQGEERFSVPGQSIDSRNSLEGAIVEADMDHERSVEQGTASVVREEPLKLAARLKLVRDSLQSDLEHNAGEREMPLPVKGQMITIKDPFHVGQRIEDTLEWQVTNVRPVDKTVVKEQAKALGISEEMVEKALESRPQQSQMFLARNKDEILSTIKSLIAADHEGYTLSLEQDEAAFESLPVLTRMQLVASADRALYRAYNREIVNHVGGNPLAMSNMGVINGTRLQLRDLVAGWCKPDTDTQRELQEALSRGARMPQFEVAPVVKQPMEAEKALAAHRAAA